MWIPFAFDDSYFGAIDGLHQSECAIVGLIVKRSDIDDKFVHHGQDIFDGFDNRVIEFDRIANESKSRDIQRTDLSIQTGKWAWKINCLSLFDGQRFAQ